MADKNQVRKKKSGENLKKTLRVTMPTPYEYFMIFSKFITDNEDFIGDCSRFDS